MIFRFYKFFSMQTYDGEMKEPATCKLVKVGMKAVFSRAFFVCLSLLLSLSLSFSILCRQCDRCYWELWEIYGLKFCHRGYVWSVQPSHIMLSIKEVKGDDSPGHMITRLEKSLQSPYYCPSSPYKTQPSKLHPQRLDIFGAEIAHFFCQELTERR